MSSNGAGKGSKPRPVVKSIYDKNHDGIKWKSKTCKKSDK